MQRSFYTALCTRKVDVQEEQIYIVEENEKEKWSKTYFK